MFYSTNIRQQLLLLIKFALSSFLDMAQNHWSKLTVFRVYSSKLHNITVGIEIILVCI